MDAPDDAVDLLELSIAATLRSQSVPIVGELWVVWSASALAFAPSTTASATSASSPPPAATAMATCGVVSGLVPGESAAVAGAWANPVSLTLCAHGEALHLAAVLEQVVAVRVDVAPWFLLTLRSRRRLAFLGRGSVMKTRLSGPGSRFLFLAGVTLSLGLPSSGTLTRSSTRA